ncbi:helix-turn-helix domain-containing protein [Nocardiopsis alba]|uniref:helix-turn-helix domain-containing protein n=1 Tax=Nocardiopsis alba TaxID=53437 RepID=UPI0003785513|nr:helix-turn-helix domain-containing protein [Nocardiopsis alba]
MGRPAPDTIARDEEDAVSGYAHIARGGFGGDRFTIVANAAIRDPHLSYKARGLLALIASHREGWGITEKRLADQSPDGISSVRSGLKELEAAGYLRRYRVRNELGQLGGAHWVITDDPTSLNARVTDLAGALGKDGGDLVPLPMSRSGPKCDFPKSAEPTEAEPPEDDRAPKKTNHKNTVATESGEGEEDARARANGSPVDNPHEWGIDPADRPGAEQGALLARTVVSQIAEETGLGLDPWQHKRLVLEHIPAAFTAVKALDDDRVGGTELLEWLRSGHETTMSLYAVLSRRCAPDFLSQALPVWVARTRSPAGLPALSAPRPRRESAPDPNADTDPFTRAGAPPTCSVHSGVTLTADATGQRTRCRMCEELPPPDEDASEPTTDDLIDVLDDALPDTDHELPDHCGNERCHRDYRMILIKRGGTIEQMPCPSCHPDHAERPNG